MLRKYPVSRQWFRLLGERLDAVAMLYQVAAVVAEADPQRHRGVSSLRSVPPPAKLLKETLRA